jgi:hypothetical protein
MRLGQNGQKRVQQQFSSERVNKLQLEEYLQLWQAEQAKKQR